MTAISSASSALCTLAIAAGAKILEIYEAEAVTAASKADGSPVTAADEAAEEVILAGLAKLFPGVPVVAEEAVEAGNLPVVQNRYFLVDPLDGTKEFISRNGQFTVNIALIEDGLPVFGVVYAPALDEIYWGGAFPAEMSDSQDAGAYQADVLDGVLGAVRKIAVRPVPAGGLSVLASRSHLSAETAEFIEKFEVDEKLSVGSSLKLCWVACGKADLYPRMAPTMQWDIAAGDAVLRAAGGTVLEAETWTLRRYAVPEGAVKSDLLNPYFVAVSDVEILAAAGFPVAG
ncbi:3'(2'),5'-bisphosphate nucleotidase CysQ [Roseibium sp. CAU 1637]|uniref:3'(2'),5'-bisphosphate nucleotidase CysQ n=1 Tax=Roseibium limicola TaxID=2816037 RepID=A0A939J7G2_9HYPH|nr:3'(2'),5'-bisphosphate nucleotidase CysQ [Roseibium limicola]MBO0346147.1 3'(2'),5'-bisphosphate nucleotidase CysQ [Roseibium limicola]